MLDLITGFFPGIRMHALQAEPQVVEHVGEEGCASRSPDIRIAAPVELYFRPDAFDELAEDGISDLTMALVDPEPGNEQ